MTARPPRHPEPKSQTPVERSADSSQEVAGGIVVGGITLVSLAGFAQAALASARARDVALGYHPRWGPHAAALVTTGVVLVGVSGHLVVRSISR